MVAAGLVPAPGDEVVDARGLLVVPGLIDLHVHVFAGASHYWIAPDPHCLATGVTTVVDAGSSGALTFPAFRQFVIELVETRILPMLKISATGMLSAEVSELPTRASPSAARPRVRVCLAVALAVRRRRGAHGVCPERHRAVPERRAIRGQDPQGPEASGPPRLGAEQVRADGQPEGGPGARPDATAVDSAAGGPADRVRRSPVPRRAKSAYAESLAGVGPIEVVDRSRLKPHAPRRAINV